MKRHIGILLFIAALAEPSWGQKSYPTIEETDMLPDSLKTLYADSITNYFYGDMFIMAKGSLPFYPIDEKGNYRSFMKGVPSGKGKPEVNCVIFISTADNRKTDGYECWCTMFVQDLEACERRCITVQKKIRSVKKHTKFKIVAYLPCDTPCYNRKELKRITAYVKYEPLYRYETEITYKLDHLKYSNSDKYNRHMKMLKGGWTYTLDKEMREQDKQKVAERNMSRQL